MNLTSKHKGNIAVARALSYFTSKGYYLFLPVGDNGGPIDMAISEDGTHLQRVQCKYTQTYAKANKSAYQVVLPHRNTQQYTEQSFDLLYVATPTGDYLIPWAQYCQKRGGVPVIIAFYATMDSYRIELV